MPAVGQQLNGQEFTLVIGTGIDHSIFDVYIDGSLWESFDGYQSATGERKINIYLIKGGAHTIDIRNRREKNVNSSGYKVTFKRLEMWETIYDAQTIAYTYDAISRIDTAKYYAGTLVSGTPFREYDYDFDEAGNRLSESLTLNGGVPTVTAFTYNAANQISSGGFAYDPNGNLIDDGPNVYIWDRGNRLMSMGGAAYGYDGLGNRIRQTVSSVVTTYLNDVQPGLVNMIGRTTSGNTDYFVHGLHGVHGMENAAGVWSWALHDGLNSVRGEVNNTQEVLGIRHFGGYGDVFGAVGSFGLPFLFTGEPRDITDLQFHRARYYNPRLGGWVSLDPFEGMMDQAMSLNGYSWVSGNVTNKSDPTGMIDWNNPIQPGGTIFVIEPGDCLSCIAQEAGVIALGRGGPQNPIVGTAYHSFIRNLVTLNNIQNPNLIIANQSLYIPPILLWEDVIHDIYATGRANQNTCRCSNVLEQTVTEPFLSPSLANGNYVTLGGYIEGGSGQVQIGSATPAFVGSEVVYNFSTFQKMRFRISRISGDTTPAFATFVNGYVGNVSGFLPNLVNTPPDDYSQFIAQYGGLTTSVTASAGVSAFGFFGVSGTAALYSSGSGIAGIVVGGSANIDLSLPFDVGYADTLATPEWGQEQFYIDKRDCKVNRSQLFWDIFLGFGSNNVIFPNLFQPNALTLSRTVAAFAADDAAERYNRNPIPCC